MSVHERSASPHQENGVRIERTFKRFTVAQRWEHAFLMLSFSVLLLTGLPQKYFASWGYRILTTPDSLMLVRRIHHIFAVILTLEVIYHLGRGIYLMAIRRLQGDIFPTWQDVQDAWKMIKYLLFLSKEKPKFGKYNFEQKFTYWFLFLGIGIMVISGFIVWFPIVWTRVFPGGIIPAAQLAHSSEAIAAGIFIVIWHFFHVHIERLNLSIFTGRLNERDMRDYHALEYERLTGESVTDASGSAPSQGAPGIQSRERPIDA
ncbi:MAG: cytochrome b/b6 domain-containing protein [Anaerolineales bacterium]|jgi:formate dehydrogenase subunit gamma